MKIRTKSEDLRLPRTGFAVRLEGWECDSMQFDSSKSYCAAIPVSLYVMELHRDSTYAALKFGVVW